ncbi:hypothetical protein ABIB38_000348 [Massilia sp. UYP11]|uniref:hypothetical protein n=1 Tax=Massilia sp. UYP11 TaxID=1756385 RepID=UPI003D1F70CF
MNTEQMTPSRAVRGSQDFPHTQRRVAMLAAVLSAALLSACGGGGGDDDVAAAVVSGSMDGTSLARTTTGFVPQPTAPTILTPLPTTNPATIVAGARVTDFEIQNQGLAQTNVPFTFGQIVAQGQMAPTEGLAARLPDGGLVRLQTDVKATHADGSVRHMIVSGVLPNLAVGQIAKIQLLKTSAPEKSALTLQDLAASGLTSDIVLTHEGVQYTASLAGALASPKPVQWLSGPVVSEWILSTPLKNAAGVEHPLLTASFAVRWYAGLSKQARVDVIVENTKTFKAGARNQRYDVNVNVGGRSIFAKSQMAHYHHSRWHQSGWWDASRAPNIHVRPNTAYLIASKAISNYDQNIEINENSLAIMGKQITAANTGPMTIGPVVAYMATTGGRGDIGPLPSWTVSYLLSMDMRARNAMMAAADGSGTWSIHMRDEQTGFPLRVDNDAYKNLSTHMNLAHKGPLPVPRCADNNKGLCSTPNTEDTAHQPSLAYLPYLLTGDYYYLEELQFWAAANPLATDPANSGNGKGLVRWQQVRGQAWSLRTLGHAAYITPDTHTLKDYFVKQLDNNLDFYHATYVVGNPNQLGVYDGSGAGAFAVSASAPWQDDFLTWSFGYLAELGFSKAQPILNWKAKYPVGRMTTPGYCWIQASAYYLEFRPGAKQPLFTDLATMHQFNFGGDSISNESKRLTHPDGQKYIDQPCASQAQSDWFRAATKGHWTAGRMSGFSDSPLGYPANMQPALAVAATSGIANAAQAWTVFTGRADKQDYGRGPQWAIIPR